jgi:hypothetical protein
LNGAASDILRDFPGDRISHSHPPNADFLEKLQAIGIVTEDGKLIRETISAGPIPARPLKKT